MAGKKKFIKGRLLIGGSGVPYVTAFTLPPMKMEGVEVTDLEGNSYLFDNTRYEDPTATFKLGGPLPPEQMAKLQDAGTLLTLTHKGVYTVAGSNNTTYEGHSCIILAQPGGWEPSEGTAGDGGDFEVSYIPKSITFSDGYGREIFFYDYFTHVKRINGQPTASKERQLLGYS